MDISVLIVFMAASLAALFVLGRGKSLALAEQSNSAKPLNSLPFHYGMITVLWSGLPAVTLLALWVIFQSSVIEQMVLHSLPDSVQAMDLSERELILNKVYNVAYDQHVGEAPPFVLQAAQLVLSLEQRSSWLSALLVLLTIAICGGLTWMRIRPEMRARVSVEIIFKNALLACACIAILTTIGIVLSVLFESLRFFHSVPVTDFLFGTEWSPQNAMRSDQVVGESSFGAVPLFAGTLLIALIAMLVAVPTGLMSAIYLAEYAPKKVRSTVKPLLEILAGIPTVVYGFIAALTVAPFIRDFATMLGLGEYVTSESALAAGLVMGVMIIPFVSSLSDDVINAVPQSLRDGALGLGSTKSEVVKRVVIPAALPGIVGSILLAVSRAIGETMIVVMAAGLAANLTANPLDSVTTVTVQIVTLLVGDQEFDSPKTLAAFALGLMLFVVTLSLNYVSLHVVKKYREQYE